MHFKGLNSSARASVTGVFRLAVGVGGSGQQYKSVPHLVSPLQALIFSYLYQQSHEKCEHGAIQGNYPVDRRHIETSLAQPANLVPLQPDRTGQLSMTE